MKIFVGGSSLDTNEKCFLCAAEAVGEFIARNGHDFFFGGCNTGLMGVAYRAALQNPACKIYVTISEQYKDDLKALKRYIVYMRNTLSERKDDMIKQSDMIIFLPGGIGTIDEIMTAIEAKRSGDYEGKIVLLNIDGYYDSLIHQLDYADWKGFSKRTSTYCQIFNSVSAAIQALEGTA